MIVMVLALNTRKYNMTDKIVNIFNKQPVNPDQTDTDFVKEVLDEVNGMKDELEDIIVLGITKEGELITRASDLTRESAYFVLSIARNAALYD